MDEVLAPDERFALVIADPPWVPRAETGRFPEDPLLAIDGGDDGLDLARACWAARRPAPAGRRLGGAAARHRATRSRRLARRAAGTRPAAASGETRSFERGACCVALDRR